jgi:hypothetical protein
LEDAGRELVCALHSNDPDIAVLASAILEADLSIADAFGRAGNREGIYELNWDRIRSA